MTRRDPIDILTEALEHHAGTELGDELAATRQHFANLREVAGLVSSAAAKHTAGAARLRVEGGNVQRDGAPILNRDAVGRLHNAAKHARRALDAGACSACAVAGDAGIDVRDRQEATGLCVECGRVVGRI